METQLYTKEDFTFTGRLFTLSLLRESLGGESESKYGAWLVQLSEGEDRPLTIARVPDVEVALKAIGQIRFTASLGILPDDVSGPFNLFYSIAADITEKARA